MNVNTGAYIGLPTGMDEGAAMRAASEFLGCSPADLVRVDGTPDQVEALSRNVRAGAGVKDKRRARARAQRASRKRNR